MEETLKLVDRARQELYRATLDQHRAWNERTLNDWSEREDLEDIIELADDQNQTDARIRVTCKRILRRQQAGASRHNPQFGRF